MSTQIASSKDTLAIFPELHASHILSSALRLGLALGLLLGLRWSSSPVQASSLSTSFAAPVPFATGANPSAVATGDFNLDGALDLVTANQASNTVSVLLNTTPPGAAAPSFAAKADFAVGTAPAGIAAGDLNGDGRPDLVTANSTGADISVLLNTTAPGAATPTFAASQSFTVGSGPQSVALADLNGDGLLDLVAAVSSTRSVAVLLNTTAPGASTPSFSTHQDFATGVSPQSVAPGDLNNDGNLDLVTANAEGNVSVLLNTISPGAFMPSFSPHQDFPTNSSSQSVALGDLNSDGRLDLVTAQPASGVLNVLLNTTAPGAAVPAFSAPRLFSAGAGSQSVAVSDLNGDGLPDLVAASDTGGALSVLLNATPPGAAAPVFAPKLSFAAGTNPRFVALADLNRDGKPDLVVPNGTPATVSVWLQTTDWGSIPPGFAPKTDFTTPSHPYAMAAVDFNLDGRLDLVAANQNANNLSVLLNTTTPGGVTPGFSAHTDFPVGAGPVAVACGDFNHDGKPDLVIANQAANTVTVLLNSTAPGAAVPSITMPHNFAVGTSPSSVAVGDLNGDGRPDLVTANSTGNNVSVLLNTTAPGAAVPAFAASQTFIAGSAPQSVAIADLNSDGKLDLVVANAAGNNVSVLLNTSAPGAVFTSFTLSTFFAVGASPQAVSVGDLNSDGRPDLVTANQADDTVSVLLNTTATGAATPSFAAATSFTVGAAPLSAAVGDLNADGLPDLVTAGNTAGTLTVLRSTTPPGAAAPSFALPQDFTTGAGPRSVIIADWNNDGKPDLAAANDTAGTLSVLLNKPPHFTDYLPVVRKP